MESNKLNSFIFYIASLIWEILLDVLSVLFILPIRILRALFSMNATDSMPFIKTDIYYHLNKLKKHGITLHVSIKQGNPSVKVQSYYEEIEGYKQLFKNDKHTSQKTFIEDALLTLKKCSFLTLQTDESGMSFIQYRYNTGTYCFDFPLTPLTLNREHSTEIIHLLRNKGFSKFNNVKGDAFKYKTYTIYSDEDDMTIISADFGNNLKLVVEFSEEVFRNIFQVKNMPEAIFI